MSFIEKLEERLDELGMDILYWARDFAPRNTTPYPNIFTDPFKPSFVNDLINKNGVIEKPIISLDYFKETNGFKRELERYGSSPARTRTLF